MLPGAVQVGLLLSTSVPLPGAATSGTLLYCRPEPVNTSMVAVVGVGWSHSMPWVASQPAGSC